MSLLRTYVMTSPNPDSLPKKNLTIVPIITTDLSDIYQKRINRIQAIKTDSIFKDYLVLLEQIVKIQKNIHEKNQLGQLPNSGKTSMPYAIENQMDNDAWQLALMEIIGGLLPLVDNKVSTVLRKLMAENKNQLQTYATLLREGKFSAVPAEYSLFIWSALSVYWAHWAPDAIKGLNTADCSEANLCPVCGSHPVVSIITDQPRKGLRYLHCSLCETQWHRVRASCTNCNEADKVYLWAEEEKDAQIRIESCEHCHGYTKMLFTNLNPNLEPVIDDLISLHFDQRVTEEGFKSTGVNPFLLSHEA